MTDTERDLIERAIAEAQLRPYQAMVIRTIAEGENMTAALTFLQQVGEVRDGAATTG